jgi:hypothetical protein
VFLKCSSDRLFNAVTLSLTALAAGSVPIQLSSLPCLSMLSLTLATTRAVIPTLHPSESRSLPDAAIAGVIIGPTIVGISIGLWLKINRVRRSKRELRPKEDGSEFPVREERAPVEGLDPRHWLHMRYHDATNPLSEFVGGPPKPPVVAGLDVAGDLSENAEGSAAAAGGRYLSLFFSRVF